MLTAERLREVLHYDPATGIFTWKEKVADKVIVGREAGHVGSRGYRYLRVFGRIYILHRLVFLYMTSEWPAQDVDHIDGDKLNNAWSNLRPASRSQNIANSRLRAGRTLPKGVTCRAGRFLAQITQNGRSTYLGSFSTPGEAHRVYMTAARDLHGEFARAG